MSNSIIQTVTEYYQRCLLSSDDTKGLEHLQSKGITSRDALDVFGVGYANTELIKVISPKQMEDLREIKLIKGRGILRFQSSIIFPLHDLEDNLVDIYGVCLGTKPDPKCLGDEAKGIGNAKALKVYDDIIVTDFPFEALKLFQEGHHNVVLCPDVHAAKLIKAKKVTVLSYNSVEELARHIHAEELWCACINPRDKKPSDALARIKQLKKPKPVNVDGILDKVVSDLDELGYIGEEKNKKLAYLISISRKLKRPLSAIIVSSSGAGKTGLMKAVSELVPPDDKLFLSRLTPQALYYMPQDALVEKLIVVDERNGSSMADYSIRTMQTSNVLTMAKPKAKDGIKSINVRCAYMESTTSDAINPENANRCFLLHLDESPESTDAILKAQRVARLGTSGQDNTQWHHDFQQGLKSLPVLIPYVESISFPCHKVSYRREQEKFLGLIEASALLHQHERQIKEGYILADMEDYRIAYELFISVFEDSSREVSRNALLFLEYLEKASIVEFTIRNAISLTGWNYSMVYRCIRELMNYEYIQQNNDKKGRHQKTYTRLNYQIYQNKVHGLIPPDELSKNFSPSFHKLSTNFSNEGVANKGSYNLSLQEK